MPHRHRLGSDLALRFTLLLPALLAGCAGEIDDDGVAVGQGMRGSLLATVEVDDATRVSFWELEGGVPAIRESVAMDLVADGAEARTPAALDGLDLEQVGLAGAYRALRPDEPVPAVLLEADARAAALRAAAAPATNRALASGGESGGDGEPRRDADKTPRSPDYYGDNYGAQWFLNIYCSAAPFRWCETNWGWFYTGRTYARQFKSCVMAADFEARAHFHGYEYTNIVCRPDGACSMRSTQLWDFQVQPRQIECVTVARTGHFEAKGEGLQPAPRIHFAKLWWL